MRSVVAVELVNKTNLVEDALEKDIASGRAFCCVTFDQFQCETDKNINQMLYHWKAMYLPVTIRPVVELPSGAVSINTRSNKVTIDRF